MKRKLLVCVVISSLSGVANAASPFLVNYTSAEAAGGRAIAKPPQAKPVTLAESLIQLNQCESAEHIGSGSNTVFIENMRPLSKQKN